MTSLTSCLACVVLNENLIDISILLKRYSFADAADEVKLRGELALWRQRWIRLKTESNVVVPETAADALEACDRMTFPFIHAFLCILVTLPVSTASAERSFSTTETQDVAKVSDDRRTTDGSGSHEHSSRYTCRRRQGHRSLC